MILLLLAAFLHLVFGEPIVYFREDFDDGDTWQTRWMESKNRTDYGQFKLTAGKYYGDPEKNIGIQTSEDNKFYAVATKFDPFTNDGQVLVIQFSVKHEQNIECGGGYLKLFPASLVPEEMHGESVYYIMFGPDICGPADKKVHVIFRYRNLNHLLKKEIKCKDDGLTHLYTLIVRPDNTYKVKIDNKKVQAGNMIDDWDLFPPKIIKDPNAKKPDDWDENEEIDDPNDVKPEGWDVPEEIPDRSARKPVDWDDEMDGVWEPAMIRNPAHRGEWKPRKIENPNYKGKWVHPEIENPEYIPDSHVYRYYNIGAIGFDLWQVRAGTIFDNILITNDEKLAEKIGAETWGATREAEKKMKEKLDDEAKKRKEEEERRIKEELKKAQEEEEEVEEEDDEEQEEEDDGSEVKVEKVSEDGETTADSSNKDEL
ncbi:calreticulin-like [Protopterus annectens]|uniref:calreticulin-like n=1 Tax=Protopterus annectens TaxID=7888 RepID=UPI001CFAB530|nr:calreticulin-like [Protopterus annectens]